jgi:peptidoglycan LD-endopeptidase CwlK
MFDLRTEKILASLDPKARRMFVPFVEEAKEIAEDLGVEYVAISGNRTWAEQNALYAIGRTRPGRKVTNARGGYSNHNFGIAVDFGAFKDGKYLDTYNPKLASKVHKAIGKIAEKYGIEWGGNWRFVDEPHFEIDTVYTTAQKRERFLNGLAII